MENGQEKDQKDPDEGLVPLTNPRIEEGPFSERRRLLADTFAVPAPFETCQAVRFVKLPGVINKVQVNSGVSGHFQGCQGSVGQHFDHSG